jgi:CMP-N-acetylneuraminic acid synthetase
VTAAYVALIPARGGSQGVPRKNLEMIGEQSLLERAIASALGVEQISACFVSSEDDQILQEAEKSGALPLRRAVSAASNSARAHEVVEDFLKQRPEIVDDDAIVYLQPTSPFRTAERVSEAIAVHERGSGESVVSVVRSHQLPEKSLTITSSGALQLAPGAKDPGKNRQDFPESVYPNGAIYIFSVAAFKRLGDIPVVGAFALMMSKVESLDIDDAEDLILARGVASHAGI